MGRLHYAANISLDGFIEDAHGNFDWSVPSDDEHRFINDLIRPIGTHLYGRRLYETMSVWETDAALTTATPVTADFAQSWQAADKVVYSSTLKSALTARTRIEPRFDPGAVAAMKASLEHDLLIGGAALAAQAIAAGLVDEYHFLFAPVVLGSGKAGLPDNVRLDLELRETRRFENGVVYLRYSVRP